MEYNKDLKDITAKRLKELREGKGLSHEKLAEELKIKYSKCEDGGILKRNEINNNIYWDDVPSPVSVSVLKNYEITTDRYIVKSRTKSGYGMSISYLVMFADFYDVSVEYLLGITDIKSTNTDVKAIHEKTGLSDMAIGNMISENVSQIGNTSILSELLSKELFYKLLYDIHNLVNANIKKLIYEKTIEENPSLQTWLKLKEEQRKENKEDAYTVTLNPADFYVFRENKLKEAFIGIAREFIDSTLERIDINDFAGDKPLFNDYEVYLKERKQKR